jgi:hypothetical protein
MDKSKIGKTSPKSSETPWEPTDPSRKHERRRLSDRAGTVRSDHVQSGLVGSTTKRKSWAGKRRNKGIPVAGKFPGSDKPLKRGWLSNRPKKSGEESEY